MKKNHRNLYTTSVKDKFTAAIRQAIEEVKRGDVVTVSISKGNRKMGPIPSVSIMPYMTCPHSCAGTCGPDCYAANMANTWTNTLLAWARNTALCVYRPGLYWKQVNAAVSMSRFFRFHVGGDIPSPAYFGKMVECAVNNPHCDIVAFTKRHEWVNQYIQENGSLPHNLHIIMSGWENLDPVNPYGLPETNVIMPGMECPENWTRCGGNCSDCARANGGCWAAGCGDVIAFDLH